jgi:predicted NBD/HSP70 family sugar kinase
MATPNLLRTINETRVLNLLFQRGPHSRADIARELQVTRSTASALVAGLVERDLLLETEETADVERIGRPGFVVKLNPGARTYIGVDIAVSELRIVALDMKADVIGSLTVPYTDPATPDYVVGLVRPAVEKLLADNGLDFSVVEGLGVAIPGLVETDGVIVFAPILNWRNVDIKAMIEQAFDVPINLYFDNDANACAVSEGYRADTSASGTLAYFLMDSGVGLGILHQGQVFRGQEGVAGEIGHARFFGGFSDDVDFAATPTFEDTVGREGVLRMCARHQVPATTIREFVDLAQTGDPGARRVYEIWVRCLAVGVANLCVILNPEEIVFGGKTAALFAIDPKRVHDETNRHLRFMFKTPVLRSSALGVLAASVGMASVMHRQSFAVSANTDGALSA